MSLSLLAGLAVAESGGATTAETVPETTGVEVLPPDEPWGGANRGEWNARAWQWLVGFPPEFDPSSDASGERCGYGQFGPVFFLRGRVGAGETTCLVAEGTAISVIVAGALCTTVGPPPSIGRNEDELQRCAATELDALPIEFQAIVDGQDVANLDAFRTTSPMFTLTFAENNGFGVEPGVVAQAVSEAYSFIIAPPPPGEYVVAWSVMYPGSTEPYGGAVTVVVEAPQVIEPPTTWTATRRITTPVQGPPGRYGLTGMTPGPWYEAHLYVPAEAPFC